MAICTCGESCGTACSQACGSSCSGSCGTTCQRGCATTCATGCATGCRGSCTRSCGDACSNNCNDTCKDTCTGTCEGACNIGCKDGELATLYTNLSLDEKFNQSNITDIANLIYNEANRRAKSPTNLTFTVGEVLNATDIATIINNLNKTGHTTTYTATAGEKGLRELGLDLIAKAKAAYEEVVVVEGS